MDQSSARRDAIRVFRLLLIFQLLFLGLTIIAALAFFRGPVTSTVRSDCRVETPFADKTNRLGVPRVQTDL